MAKKPRKPCNHCGGPKPPGKGRRHCDACIAAGIEYPDRTTGRVNVIVDGRQERRYRLVMAEVLGRPLRADETVHHINKDTSDDRPENLQVLSRSEHGAIHSPEGQAARRANRRFEWSRDHACCVDCGTTERPYYASGQCRTCYHRNYNRAWRAEKAAA